MLHYHPDRQVPKLDVGSGAYSQTARLLDEWANQPDSSIGLISIIVMIIIMIMIVISSIGLIFILITVMISLIIVMMIIMIMLNQPDSSIFEMIVRSSIMVIRDSN